MFLNRNPRTRGFGPFPRGLSAGGGTRAKPVSFRRPNYFEYTNLREPVSTQRVGVRGGWSGQRSYADVVRNPPPRYQQRNRVGGWAEDGNWINRRNQTQTRPQVRFQTQPYEQRRQREQRETQDGDRNIRQNDTYPRIAAPPELSKATKTIYNIFSATHHRKNLQEGRKGEQMIQNLTQNLTTFLKPAIPNSKLQQDLATIAEDWGKAVTETLEEHYQNVVVHSLEELERGNFEDWTKALEIAERWVYRRLPRIPTRIFNIARDLVVENAVEFTERDREDLGGETQETMETQGETQGEDGALISPITNQNEGRSEERIWRSTPITAGWVTPLPRRKGKTPLKKKEGFTFKNRTRRDNNTPEEEAEKQTQQQEQQTQTESQIEQEPQGEQEEERQENRETQTDNEQDIQFMSQFVTMDKLEETEVGREEMEEGERSSKQKERREEEEESEEGQIGEYGRDGQKGIRRHPTTNQKFLKWKLFIDQKSIILGDSNLSRISNPNIPDLQIDSFPGANLTHGTFLIQTAKANSEVESLIISLGLNDRRKGEERNSREVLRLLKATQERFPQAKIWMAHINFSEDLPKDERDNLCQLNGLLKKHFNILPPIPQEKFKTGEDKIHWTQETAELFLEGVRTVLN